MPRPIKRKARPVRVAKGSDDTWKAKKAKRDAANLEKLKSAMTKYDIDGSTALSRPEIQQLLGDPACAPAGNPHAESVAKPKLPTDDETGLIFKLSDVNGDGQISAEELGFALRAWHCYQFKQDWFVKTLEKHDKSGDGSLQKDEMACFLTELNDGVQVTESEVEWVMEEADYVKDGSIDKFEMLVAVAGWYASGEGGDDRLLAGFENMADHKDSDADKLDKGEKGGAGSENSGADKSACCVVS